MDARYLFLGFVAFSGVFGICHPLPAQLENVGLSVQHVTGSLVSEVSAIAPGKPFRVAVKLQHDEHWHTYGKEIPEDQTGKPTSIIWSLPEGWKSEDLPWPPTKKVASTGGATADGYDGTVYLGVLITPPASLKPGETAKLKAQVDALVCDPQTCVPVRDLFVSLDLKVAAEPVQDAANAKIFEAISDLEKKK